MLVRIISASSIGLILGYLSGFYVTYTESLIKLVLTFILIALLFVKTAYNDELLRSVLVFVIAGSIMFMFGTIRANLLLSQETLIKDNVSITGEIRNISIKDSTRVLLVRDSDYQHNIAVYTNSALDYTVGENVRLEGVITNNLIMRPDYDDDLYSVRSFDLINYWRSQGVEYIMMRPTISKLELESHKDLSYFSYNLRQSINEKLKMVMDNEHAGILSAMLYGDESNISKDTRESYNKSGLSHILVLSGYNIVLIVSFTALLFRRLSFRSRILMSVAVIGVFTSLASIGISAIRAVMMTLYGLGGALVYREVSSKLAVWGTSLILMIYSPYLAVYSVSFHLSFLATLSIIYFFPLINNLYNLKDENNKEEKGIDFAYKLRQLLIVTIAVNILIMPYLFYQFGYINVLSIPASILASMLVPLIMLSGSLVALISYISLPIAKILAYVPETLISALSGIARSIKDMLLVSSLNLSSLMLCYVVIYFFFVSLNLIIKIRDSHKGGIYSSNY